MQKGSLYSVRARSGMILRANLLLVVNYRQFCSICSY